jgi:YihY family inner membrane protein
MNVINKKIKLFFKKFILIVKRSTVRFFENQNLMISNGLTLKTVIAFIPLAIVLTDAMKFFLPKENIKGKIILFLKDFILPPSLDSVTRLINRAIDNSTQMSLISILMLVYLGVDLFVTLDFQVERIWIIKQKKRITERILKYWMLLAVTPFILVGYFYYSGFIRSFMNSIPFISDISNAANIFYYLLSILLLTLFIFMIYYIIPSAKVDFGKAVVVSILVFISCVVFKYFFSYYSYNFLHKSHLIYGAFATAVLFVFWTSLNWTAILFGQELLYVWQNKEYKKEKSFGKVFFFDLAFFLAVIKEFENDLLGENKGLTAKEIASRFCMDVRATGEIIDILDKNKILVSDSRNYVRYYLAKELSKIELSEIEKILWKNIFKTAVKKSESIKKVHVQLEKYYLNREASGITLSKFFK